MIHFIPLVKLLYSKSKICIVQYYEEIFLAKQKKLTFDIKKLG